MTTISHVSRLILSQVPDPLPKVDWGTWQVDSLLLHLHLLAPEPAHQPVGAVENLVRFKKSIMFFFLTILFIIETIIHLHIKHLNLKTIKMSTYKKMYFFHLEDLMHIYLVKS